MKRRRNLVLGGAAAPNPVSITDGAVSAWLRVASGTVTGQGYSSVPDALNSNPAVQSVDARRPAAATSNNGLPCMSFATNCVLSWPLIAAINGASKLGFGMWIKLNAASSTQRLIQMAPTTGGANGIKLTLTANAANLNSVSSSNGTLTRNDAPTSNDLNTSWKFVTVEYDGAAADETHGYVLSVGGNVLTNAITGTGTFGSLFVPTGNALIGNGQDAASASGPLNGLLGPNIYAFGSKMTGATSGLLTPAARAALMSFEAPT